MKAQKVSCRDGKVYIDDIETADIGDVAPDEPTLYSSFRETINNDTVVRVYNGVGWLVFRENGLPSYGAFDVVPS